MITLCIMRDSSIATFGRGSAGIRGAVRGRRPAHPAVTLGAAHDLCPWTRIASPWPTSGRLPSARRARGTPTGRSIRLRGTWHEAVEAPEHHRVGGCRTKRVVSRYAGAGHRPSVSSASRPAGWVKQKVEPSPCVDSTLTMSPCRSPIPVITARPIRITSTVPGGDRRSCSDLFTDEIRESFSHSAPGGERNGECPAHFSAYFIVQTSQRSLTPLSYSQVFI